MSTNSDGKRRVRSSLGGLLLLTSAALCCAGPLAALGTERTWRKTFTLPPGAQVSVENVQGGIAVEGWDRAQVAATVVIRCAKPTDQIDQVQVAAELTGSRLVFHTLYPQGLDTPIRVDYHLRVPRQVRLAGLNTLAGDIAVNDVEGSLEARSLHGDIAGFNISGAVVAHALTGNILVSLDALPDRHLPVTLGTINGNVQLVLPAEANANLELSTLAGKIIGNYPFQVSDTPGDRTRRARVGAGGTEVQLRTVKGDIRVSQQTEQL